jgi:hypothetical protein
MSQQIDTALVNQYRSNIEVQFQQMNSRLRPTVVVETQNAEYEYYDRIGATEAQDVPTRHSDTQYTDTPHTRRRNQTKPKFWADLIDKRDRLRMLADPTSAYTQNAVAALNRSIDRTIITAFDATAYAGKEGQTAVTFPAAQEIAVNYVESGGAANSNLTIAKLRRARFLLDSKEAVMDGEPMYIAVTAAQLQSLLRTTEITSADYNTVKALVKGEIDTFMGFKFIRLELLPKSGNIRSCFAYPRSAITLGVAEDIFVSVDRLPTKHFSVQVYVSLDMGAVRMWEEKVVRILCDETA